MSEQEQIAAQQRAPTAIPGRLEVVPTLVAHADWGTAPAKRWQAQATLRNGRYIATAPQPVGDATTLLARLRATADDRTQPGGAVFVGFDFPIGLPAAYAEQVGVADFLTFLPSLGREECAAFYDFAERADEIGPYRPFYPRRPGGTRQHHLLAALGLDAVDKLRRRCEARHEDRAAASPLFWTLGAQQVGRTAIAGWRDVLAPGLRDPTLDVAIWPFAGRLDELLRAGRIVVAETYPAEVYHHLRITWPVTTPGRRSGKRSSIARQTVAPTLLRWADATGVALDPPLRAAIVDGFGPSPSGEDPFDAVVGLFGMLNVVLGRRSSGDPDDERIRRVEGWILGQRAAR